MTATKAAKLWRKTRWAIKSAIDVANLPNLRADKKHLDGMTDRTAMLQSICRKRGKNCIVANQVVSEISSLCDILAERPPGVVLEIGTAKGGTLYLWSRLARNHALLISIDMPGEVGSVRGVNRAVYRTFGKERGIKVHTLAMDSHSPRTHVRLKQLLGNRKIDLLFIDGDHSYAGVKADFNDYMPYMAANGLIAMHDIAIPPTDSWIRVQQFWNEVCSNGYRTKSILAPQGERCGIGVVFLGKR